MSNTKSNWPTATPSSINPEKLSAQIKVIKDLRRLPKINTNNPEEIEARADKFLDYCEEVGCRPTMELLSVALNVDRSTLWRWAQIGDERGQVIKSFKESLAALVTMWGADGDMAPVSYVAVMNNNYGWKNSLAVEAVNYDRLNALPTSEEIMQRLPKLQNEEFSDEDLEGALS